MTRVKRGVQKRKRHKALLKQAKGFYGRAKNCYRIAKQRLEKSWQYAYRDRKTRKRDFRRLWIQRINAASRQFGIVYSVFIKGLKLAEIDLDRKVLSDIAIREPEMFKLIVEKAKLALENAKS
ncbi:MAG: 50S ribosomal protein L20 [Rickettsiaceae bacterium H1]|nr:50S ribosomal protein L20 [Rickettsiaceae bacterium H1]